MKWIIFALLGFCVYQHFDYEWKIQAERLVGSRFAADLKDAKEALKAAKAEIRVVTVQVPCQEQEKQPCELCEPCERCKSYWEMCVLEGE